MNRDTVPLLTRSAAAACGLALTLWSPPAAACPLTSGDEVYYDDDGGLLSCDELMDDFLSQAESLQSSFAADSCGADIYSASSAPASDGRSALEAFLWRMTGGTDGPENYPITGCMELWSCAEIFELHDMAVETTDWMQWAVAAGLAADPSAAQDDIDLYEDIVAILAEAVEECAEGVLITELPPENPLWEDPFVGGYFYYFGDDARAAGDRVELRWTVSPLLLSSAGELEGVDSAQMVVQYTASGQPMQQIVSSLAFSEADRDSNTAGVLSASFVVPAAGQPLTLDALGVEVTLTGGAVFSAAEPVGVTYADGVVAPVLFSGLLYQYTE